MESTPSENESALSRKNSPLGGEFFFVRADTFLEGGKSNFDRVASPEAVTLLLKLPFLSSVRKVV